MPIQLNRTFVLTKIKQVLGITCDNASPNDTMIDVLPELIEGFPGAPNHTRCFNHVVALVARRIVRQFDVATGGDSDTLDEAERELRELAEGLDVEEVTAQSEREAEEDEGGDDDDDGWPDDIAGLSATDRTALDESLRPVRSLLVKVSIYSIVETYRLTWFSQLCKIAFVIIHSSTILLPLWFATLDKLKLEAKKMPRDVRTRWNSTYDMVQFALQYRAAIDDIAGNKTAGLRRYELSDEEWIIAQQLCDTLKVRRQSRFGNIRKLTQYNRSLRTLLCSFHG